MGLELDIPGSSLASIANYPSSATWLHIGLSWDEWTSYAGFHPRDSDLIELEGPGHLDL